MKKNSIIMFVIGLVIVGGVVFFFGKQKAQAPGPDNSTPVGPTEIVVNYNSKDQSFSPQTYEVKEGSETVIKITSDIADEVHFHGYDLHTDLEPNTQGQISFTANQTGRFEFELEDHKITLGVIEIYPK